MRPDGERVLRRIQRCDMLPDDIEVDLSGVTIYSDKAISGHIAKETEFQLPEMDAPVRLPASREGQRDEVIRLMEKHRPGQVYGRDWNLSGGAWR